MESGLNQYGNLHILTAAQAAVYVKIMGDWHFYLPFPTKWHGAAMHLVGLGAMQVAGEIVTYGGRSFQEFKKGKEIQYQSIAGGPSVKVPALEPIQMKIYSDVAARGQFLIRVGSTQHADAIKMVNFGYLLAGELIGDGDPIMQAFTINQESRVWPSKGHIGDLGICSTWMVSGDQRFHWYENKPGQRPVVGSMVIARVEKKMSPAYLSGFYNWSTGVWILNGYPFENDAVTHWMRFDTVEELSRDY